MNILLPAICSGDIEQLKLLTPDAEFYVGIELEEWYASFGTTAELNRMSAFGSTANMQGIDSVRSLCEAAGQNDLYLALNAPSYSKMQLSFLDSLLSEMKEFHLTGIIIGDPMLADIVRKHDMKAVASTMIGVYNADIAMWCYEHGFQRLILPRDLTLDEIQAITAQVPDVEYECFLMRNGCRYSDSHCLARHRNKYGALCTYLDHSNVSFGGAPQSSFKAHDDTVYNHHLFSKAFHRSACGLCAIWRLMKMNITSGKVVGRADGISSIEEDAGLISDNLKIASTCESEEEYLSKMVYPRNYDVICYQGLNCYYPEVRYTGKGV